jgi:Cytochrome c554 and c-prime
MHNRNTRSLGGFANPKRSLDLIGVFFLLAGGAAAESPEACAACHRAIYERQTQSHHFQALRPIAQSPIYAKLAGAGSYETRPNEVLVTVQKNAERLSAALQWAFGAGAQGITPVGIIDGQYFEHRYSYFPRAQKLALTFGHPANADTANSELGVLQDRRTITQCFNCHATGVQSGETGPNLSTILPGISCERCHGAGRSHIAAARGGATGEELRKTLLNPGRLSARAQAQVCGECHRLPAPGSPSPEPEIEDPISVRFAPIGLTASRCFIESRKLTCTTCHDAHNNARSRSDAFYSGQCLNCHADAPAVASACRRGKKEDCLPCHMRQASLGTYLMFTDHRIRVY